MRWKPLLAIVALAVTLCPVAAAAPDHVSLMLDWTPNPDHAGIYYAQQTGLFAKAGLDVTINTPSDTTAPLKLVAAGDSDLAISYEQEMFYAGAQHLPVTAVAAIVPQPLNSIMAIDPQIRSIADLRGKTIGISGVPSDYADLDTALASVGLTQSDVTIVSVGSDLLAALLSHRVAAVLDVYPNVEGIEVAQLGFSPLIIPVDRVGVPFYDELVLVANSARLASDPAYASMVRRFVAALVTGTDQARAHHARALAILAKVTDSDARFLDRAVPTTLSLLSGPDGVGCMRIAQWQHFGDWMAARKLIAHVVGANAVMTTRFLPASCQG
jgi:putative hydroxymethylpyrimidine transport system substrate-binding protein